MHSRTILTIQILHYYSSSFNSLIRFNIYFLFTSYAQLVNNYLSFCLQSKYLFVCYLSRFFNETT
ncbi:hypothetical protein BpHYR1_015709 [Brachionus plicatilis]|uniref:Uncharacterized protein n=1 Tax=Brachionus plicatilis TaxID=10195 RepID=A0A3M7RFS0_BRAPC|nr:hypothetical protein BpHYR1_015709 [Brachionus plicatilis]